MNIIMLIHAFLCYGYMPLECVYKHQKEKIFYVVINRTNLHTYTHFSNSLLKRKEFFVRDDEKNELIQADYCSYDLISMLDAIVKIFLLFLVSWNQSQ